MTKAKPTILVVDDDKNTRDGIARAMRRAYQVLLAADADDAIESLQAESVDLVLSDMRMPGRDGLSLLREIRERFPRVPVVLLTAYGSIETAVESMRDGAVNFLTKPIRLDNLEQIIRETLVQSAQPQPESSQEDGSKVSACQIEHGETLGMIGQSPAMEQVYQLIRQAAPSHASILIQGPSGTGKELVARAIHQASTRAKGPFVAVHCAALSESLLESELFGHEKGAFTGAIATKVGRFEAAAGGTLFLDEVSEIDMATQVKLLRVLETRTIERVGGSESIPVDIRLVAATNRDLKAWVAAGKFREDLYFRLNVVDINLPPLSVRQGDIQQLCEHFLTVFAQENGKPISAISPDALARLMAYPWPGNVRELRNTIEKMVVLATGNVLDVADLPLAIREPFAATLPLHQQEPIPAAQALVVPVVAPESELETILRAIEQARGNKSLAAQRLGMSRRTLYRRLDELSHPNQEV